MTKTIWLFCVLLLCSTLASAQNRIDVCILDRAKDAQTITAHGKTVQEPHDLAFAIEGCNDMVILIQAGDPDSNVSKNLLQNDKSLKRFQKFTSAVYKSTKTAICNQCAQYGDVEATLTGKLEIATLPTGTTKDHVGFVHDASGKIVGTSGFGHPIRMFKYRLVIFSASEVQARKLPKPKLPT